MGKFSVQLEVVNFFDVALERQGLMKPERVRRRVIDGVVASGAVKLVLPQSVIKQLGLALTDRVTVRYADGRTARRREAEGVYVQLLGRHGTFRAVVEPKRKSALIGAIVLEDLDLLVDCQQ